MSKELIEQLAKEHGITAHDPKHGMNWGSVSTESLEAFAKAYAQTQGKSEPERLDESPADPEVMADAKKLWKALNNLSFDCFAGIGLKQPSIKVYNETFTVMDELRHTYEDSKMNKSAIKL